MAIHRLADPALATRVLRIFIDSIERSLRVCCAARPSARPGAVSFLQRFGSALNEHWHYHYCVSDGVFDTASDGERLIYTFDKPRPDGSWQLTLTPLELLNRLARFIPAPPCAPEDLAATIRRGLGVLPQAVRPRPEPVTAASLQSRSWARLIARICEVDPLRCRHCGGTLQLIAFIVESAAIVRILDHLGEPSRAPRMAPIRGPPGAGETRDGMPDYEDQRQDVSW